MILGSAKKIEKIEEHKKQSDGGWHNTTTLSSVMHKIMFPFDKCD